MSTTRWQDPSGKNLTANIGAQYISCGKDEAGLVSELLASGEIAGPVLDPAPHSRCFGGAAAYSDYSPVRGTSSVCKANDYW